MSASIIISGQVDENGIWFLHPRLTSGRRPGVFIVVLIHLLSLSRRITWLLSAPTWCCSTRLEENTVSRRKVTDHDHIPDLSSAVPWLALQDSYCLASWLPEKPLLEWLAFEGCLMSLLCAAVLHHPLALHVEPEEIL